ncbi:MAG: deoxyhypusine synthase [Candidatus Bathyarchaeia archaeon]
MEEPTSVVEDIKLQGGMTVSDTVAQMGRAGGFTGKKLADSVDVLESMIKDGDCVKFLSFPANLIATGLRGVIKDLVRRKLFDVVVTTCGTLDHDFARVWASYYHGSFLADDAELHRRGINRIGNIFVPNDSYGITIEKRLQPMLQKMWKNGLREISTRELCWEIGKRVRSEDSILHWCWKNKVPIFVPSITDGAVGSQIWLFSQRHPLKINILRDEQELSDIVFQAKRLGALVVGGGVSKHHTIWWAQFKDGLDYAVYVTTAGEWDGSLSGARVEEAISWGKVKEDAKFSMIKGDATVILPLMVASVLDRLR